MLKFWKVQYSTLMAGMFLISIAYNNCANDAGFDLRPGVESLETFNALDNGDPAILINNNASTTQTTEVSLTLLPGGLVDQMRISNNSSCDGTWEPYQENRLWTLETLNGTSEVYAQYRYQDLTPTECVKDAILHDDMAPTVSFTSGHNQAWVSQASHTVAYLAQDSGSGVDSIECDTTGNGTFNACGQSLTFRGLIENQNYLLVVRAKDKAGNISAPQQVNWQADFTAPQVRFVQTPAALTADVTPQFIVDGTDLGSGIAGFECLVDAEPSFHACSRNQTLSALADGSHTFRVRSRDNVGRYSQPISYTWVQDATAPTIEFTQTPNPIESAASATFVYAGINASQGIVSYRCRLDNGAYASCTNTMTLNSLGNGNHTFSVIGRDGAGNDSSPISYSWTVDLMKPSIAFVETPPQFTNQGTAAFGFQATDQGSGVSEIRCQLDGGTEEVCGNRRVFNNLAAGNHSLRAVAVDLAGNTSDPINYSWVIDMTPPIASIDNAPTSGGADTEATFEFSATDAGGSGVSHYECRVDGGSYQSCSSPYTQDNISSGSHIFLVRAVDNAGNVSAVVTHTWSIMVICNPLDPSAECIKGGGLEGNLYFMTFDIHGENQTRNARLDTYRTIGVQVPTPIVMSSVDISPRSWTSGFLLPGNQFVQNGSGERLFEWFSIDIAGFISLPAGDYQLATVSDDGVRITVDGVVLINNDTTHPPAWDCANTTISFADGERKRIRVQYFQGPRTQIALQLFSRPASESGRSCSGGNGFTIVPGSALTRNTTSTPMSN